jgi:hypothetical protein
MDRSRFRHAKTDKNSRRDYWDWWLSDEQPSAAAREEIRRQRVKAANTYRARGLNNQSAQPAAAADYNEINSVIINLRVPSLDELKASKTGQVVSKYLPGRRAKAAVLAVAVLICLLLFRGGPAVSPKTQSGAGVKPAASAYPLTAKDSPLSKADSQIAGSQAQPVGGGSVLSQSAKSSRLSFKPVVPKAKPELAQSAFGQTAYDHSTGVYTFIDTYMGKPLTVNETSVTSNYKSDADAAIQNATQNNASTPLSYSEGTAYVQSPSSGSQSVILAFRGVLVFINSPVSHSQSEWADYINSLQ